MMDEYVVIPFEDNAVYTQRLEPYTASEDPLTDQEKVILYQHREIERLNQQLEYAKEYIPTEYKTLNGDIIDPVDFGSNYDRSDYTAI